MGKKNPDDFKRIWINGLNFIEPQDYFDSLFNIINLFPKL